MLRLSTRVRYALRAMIEMSLREGEGPVQLREIARAQRLSSKYLEQLAIPLRHAGLLQTARGPHGGYELAKPASEITALDIVRAVDGPIQLLDCITRMAACDRAATCAARRLWGKVSEAITAVLAEKTLAELRCDQQALLAG